MTCLEFFLFCDVVTYLFQVRLEVHFFRALMKRKTTQMVSSKSFFFPSAPMMWSKICCFCYFYFTFDSWSISKTTCKSISSTWQRFVSTFTFRQQRLSSKYYGVSWSSNAAPWRTIGDFIGNWDGIQLGIASQYNTGCVKNRNQDVNNPKPRFVKTFRKIIAELERGGKEGRRRREWRKTATDQFNLVVRINFQR